MYEHIYKYLIYISIYILIDNKQHPYTRTLILSQGKGEEAE
jgi:hypothetical protein